MFKQYKSDLTTKSKKDKMKKDTLFILGIVGLGIYLYYKHKKTINVKKDVSATPNVPVSVSPDVPVNDTGVPIVQTLDAKYKAMDENSYRAHFSLSGYKKLGNIPNTI